MRKFLLDPGMYIEFGIATVLFAVNVILAATLPYFTEHKAYFAPTPYIIVLVIIYLLYVIRVHISKKKSASGRMYVRMIDISQLELSGMSEENSMFAPISLLASCSLVST